jgi:hypothetical protein
MCLAGVNMHKQIDDIWWILFSPKRFHRVVKLEKSGLIAELILIAIILSLRFSSHLKLRLISPKN